MNCPKCGMPNADYRGQQKGIDKDTRRWFSFPYYNCSNPKCDTGFGDLSEKRFCDTGEPVNPKDGDHGR